MVIELCFLFYAFVVFYYFVLHNYGFFKCLLCVLMWRGYLCFRMCFLFCFYHMFSHVFFFKFTSCVLSFCYFLIVFRNVVYQTFLVFVSLYLKFQSRVSVLLFPCFSFLCFEIAFPFCVTKCVFVIR